MTAKQSLYLRIPVSAFPAEIRALSSAGGCHNRRIWYNGRRTRKEASGLTRPLQYRLSTGEIHDIITYTLNSIINTAARLI